MKEAEGFDLYERYRRAGRRYAEEDASVNDEELRRMQVAANIAQGHPVQITGAEYLAWGRSYIQTLAGRYIDWNDGVRAAIALEEVKRLDRLHPDPESPIDG